MKNNYYKRITFSFRIEQAMTLNVTSNRNYKNQFKICRKIADAIDIHCKAMESVFLCIW
jgi:transcriptional regulatory protein LevR